MSSRNGVFGEMEMELSRGGHWRNWVGNQAFVAGHMASPASEDEISSLVRRATRQGQNVRCSGAGHSFTPIVATSGLLLNLDRYQGVIHTDRNSRQVTVAAGTTIKALASHLKNEGLSLLNQGDIDSQTTAGAFATGTHGTGIALGNLSSNVVGMRIVTPDGSILKVDGRENIELLHATQVNLGLFGVVSEITLTVTESYNLRERLSREDFETCMEMHDELARQHRHFCFWWCPTRASRELYGFPDTAQVSRSSRDYDVCEVRVLDATTEEPSVKSAFERVGHNSEIFPQEYAPNFHELEYAVPAIYGKQALREIRELMLTKHMDCIFPVEYRFTAGDPAWISPFHNQDSVTISCSGDPKGADYWPFLRDVDRILREFGSRPHWGKLHFTNREDVDRLFPKASAFRELRRDIDPEGFFLNDHLSTLFR